MKQLSHNQVQNKGKLDLTYIMPEFDRYMRV